MNYYKNTIDFPISEAYNEISSHRTTGEQGEVMIVSTIDLRMNFECTSRFADPDTHFAVHWRDIQDIESGGPYDSRRWTLPELAEHCMKIIYGDPKPGRFNCYTESLARLLSTA